MFVVHHAHFEISYCHICSNCTFTYKSIRIQIQTSFNIQLKYHLLPETFSDLSRVNRRHTVSDNWCYFPSLLLPLNYTGILLVLFWFFIHPSIHPCNKFLKNLWTMLSSYYELGIIMGKRDMMHIFHLERQTWIK